MPTFDPDIVGFDFTGLDFIICVECAQTSPDLIKECVEEATGEAHPTDFFQVALERFALLKSDPVAHLLYCDLIECQKPLLMLEEADETTNAIQPDGE